MKKYLSLAAGATMLLGTAVGIALPTLANAQSRAGHRRGKRSRSLDVSCRPLGVHCGEHPPEGRYRHRLPGRHLRRTPAP